MGRLKCQRLKGATLVETIVSLVIILLVTGITVTVFVQITGSGHSMKKIRADLLITKYLHETNTNKKFFNEEFHEEDFVIRKEVTTGENKEGMVRVKVSVFDQQSRLIRYVNVLLRTQ